MTEKWGVDVPVEGAVEVGECAGHGGELVVAVVGGSPAKWSSPRSAKLRAAVAVHGGDDRDGGGPAAHGVAHCGPVDDGHGDELGRRCLLVIGGQAR